MVKVLIILAIVAICWWLLSKITNLFKFPKVGSFALVTGAVKSGKTTFGVGMAISQYKREHRRWKIRKFFQKLFRMQVSEEPLLYSNIPLTVPYVPVTTELLRRQARVNYRSVVYLSEASLVADNSLYKDEDLTEDIMLFCKLFGHSSCGGLCIYDTQSIGDLPAVTRRCLSQYFYVHHIVKWLPFLLIAFVREERFCEDGTTVNSYDEDVENSLKRVIMFKSVWKKFDCYTYSILTDNKPVVNNVVELEKGSSLKTSDIVSFRHWRFKDNEKKDD